MRLVIVESPAKCSKIQSYLGADYRVIATMGHIRGLLEKLDAVGIDNNWTPIYQDLDTKKDAIAKLKKSAKDADEVILASDDDREGEAIAWHVCHILKLNPATTKRIVFHEITKTAIQQAVANPRTLDMNRVNAQQARAMLDMLVGFTISRVLWKRVAPKLSAGRCQTPALRLVADRDKEIAGHTARNYWVLKGIADNGSDSPLEIKAEGEYDEGTAKAALQNAKPTVHILGRKERIATSNAPAPLITSTLQQEASALHGIGPKQTMAAAQKLYEAGHITYMRTDNPQLSSEAATMMREVIQSTWGSKYVGDVGQHTLGAEPTSKKPAKKKAAKGSVETPEAQAAHEAIRPTHPEVVELDVERTQQIVYRLIWRRAIQCQMSAAKTHVRTYSCNIDGVDATWSAEQTKPSFEGWLVVDKSEKTKESEEKDAEAWDSWSNTKVGSPCSWSSLSADETFTKPPGRYTEATLIRELEKRGIGRPSTFASLVTTLFDREYVEKTNKEGAVYETRHLTRSASDSPKSLKERKEKHKAGAEKNKIAATALGIAVTESLERDFMDLFAYDFTAHMERSLDEIAQGSKAWKTILQETWDTYKERYESAIKEKDARKIASTESGIRIVQTKKGPCLVRPKADGSGDEFAPLPEGVTAAKAAEMSEEQMEAAFQASHLAKEGELLGMWGDDEMRKKKGPYGFYVECAGLKVPWKPEDTLEEIAEKLEKKQNAFERKVGDYTIKTGPYGLYFYKHTLKTMKFHKLPCDADPALITEEELTAASKQEKKPAPKKTKN